MIYPVILSGGIGTRLWPMSRALRPKQLQKMFDERSSLQLAAARVMNRDIFMPLTCVCNRSSRFAVDRQIRELGIDDARLILEPMGRNTAAAIALAALSIDTQDKDAMMLVLSADHFIADEAGMQSAIVQAAQSLHQAQGTVLFGITPTHPETGFDYIKPVREGGPPFKVETFLEKPGRELAEEYVREGNLWNSGMFLFSLSFLCKEMAKHLPEIWDICGKAWENHSIDIAFPSFHRIHEADFSPCPSIAIDKGLMEKVDKTVVIPITVGWSDIGTWKSLFDISRREDHGNAIYGDAVLHDCQNTHVYAPDRKHFIAAIGLKDISIVHTADATLVLPHDKSQDVRHITDFLQKHQREEARQHLHSYRAWGTRDILFSADNCRAINLIMNPHAQSAMQSHAHHSEHWVVVRGQATVTIEGKIVTLNKDESIFIRPGQKHRLANQKDEPLQVMEIQTGDYLDDDDIMRFDSPYSDTDDFD